MELCALTVSIVSVDYLYFDCLGAGSGIGEAGEYCGIGMGMIAKSCIDTSITKRSIIQFQSHCYLQAVTLSWLITTMMRSRQCQKI